MTYKVRPYAGNLTETYFDPPQISTLAIKSVRAESGQKAAKLGLPQLDDHFVMAKPSKFIGILADTSHGKSAFMQFVARNMARKLDAENGEIGIYATWEDAVEKFGVNDLSAISGVPVSSVYNGQITESELKQMVKASAERMTTPLWMVGHSDQVKSFNPRLTMTDFMLVMEELLQKQKRNVKFVMIDYLQLINLADSNERETRRKYNDAIAKLRDLAMGYNLMVFVATQVKREVSDRRWNQPQIHDAMETSGFEHACDGAISLWYAHKNWKLGKEVSKAQNENDIDIAVTRDLMLIETLKQKDGNAKVLRAVDFVPEYNEFVKYGTGGNYRRTRAARLEVQNV